MTVTVDTRTRYTCDKCGKRVVRYAEDEAPLPDGWAEIAIAVWRDGQRETTQGNEDRFSQVCPKCLVGLGLFFHDATDREETP